MSQSGGEGTKGSVGDDNAGGEKKGKWIAAKSDDQSQPLTSDEDSDQAEEVPAAPRGTLDCLAALEDSLPMKRGLSGHYIGKSKSFGNLTDLPLDDPKDLAKKEHPINKKRRLLIAHELFDESTLGKGSSANAMTDQYLQAGEEDEDEEEKKDNKNQEEEEDDDDDN